MQMDANAQMLQMDRNAQMLQMDRNAQMSELIFPPHALLQYSGPRANASGQDFLYIIQGAISARIRSRSLVLAGSRGRGE